MKNLITAILFLVLSLLLIACSHKGETTPSAIPSSSATMTATATPIPTATVAIEQNPTQAYERPTLIPTIEPTFIPGLFKNVFSVQRHDGVNGHDLRQITGWSNGFWKRDYWWHWCGAYQWLDSKHMLLYPVIGQERMEVGASDLTRPVVINLDTSNIWLPPYIRNCDLPRWSQELGVLITTDNVIPLLASDEEETVQTYTPDGKDVNLYWGKLLGISPSGTKILVADDTLIDLRSGKIVDFSWYLEHDSESPYYKIYWSSDENRLYKCCYYFGDARTGRSYRFELSQFQGYSGKPETLFLYHQYGQWVLNDDAFLMEWSWIYDGDNRYLPMFDPDKKIYFDVREMAGIPDDWSCVQTMVSPDGTYVWMAGWGRSYLVNLATFNQTAYPLDGIVDFYWSSDSKFAWLRSPGGTSNEPSHYQILTVVDEELKLLTIDPLFDSLLWWHPTENVLAYISTDGQQLELLNAETMFVQEVELPSTFHHFVWSPTGEYLALIGGDGSMWKVDYPNLENLEQLTPALPDVRDVIWSPDSAYLAFVSGSDIYIVESAR
jgi:hypothetical protein